MVARDIEQSIVDTVAQAEPGPRLLQSPGSEHAPPINSTRLVPRDGVRVGRPVDLDQLADQIVNPVTLELTT